jgi:uncharacterized membrane protein YgcG
MSQDEMKTVIVQQKECSTRLKEFMDEVHMFFFSFLKNAKAVQYAAQVCVCVCVFVCVCSSKPCSSARKITPPHPGTFTDEGQKEHRSGILVHFNTYLVSWYILIQIWSFTDVEYVEEDSPREGEGRREGERERERGREGGGEGGGGGECMRIPHS